MTFHQLKIFEAVSRHLSIAQASKELRISEPSVFQQTKALEESCGVKLYRKVGRHIELTAAGQTFQTQARSILLKIEKLRQRYEVNTALARIGSLSVGGSHVPSAHILPLFIARFKRRHPLVRITLQTDCSRMVERLVLNAEVEIAIVTHPSGSFHFHQLPFRREPVVVFVSANHRLAKKRHWTLKDIGKEPLLVQRGPWGEMGTFTTEILKAIREQGHTPNVVMASNSADAVKATVMRSAGVGVLMRTHLAREIRRGELKVVNIPELRDPKVHSIIIYLKDRPLSPIAKTFLDLLGRSTPTNRMTEPVH